MTGAGVRLAFYPGKLYNKNVVKYCDRTAKMDKLTERGVGHGPKQ